ncbi:MAG: hypothetical protein WBG86_08145, partial [Polyangiales bacterium]
MSLWVEIVLTLGVPVLLIALGRVVGSRIERRHYANIAERESRFEGQPTFSTHVPGELGAIDHADLATGSVVVSIDHFKRFISGFRMMFGGEVRSYSS